MEGKKQLLCRLGRIAGWAIAVAGIVFLAVTAYIPLWYLLFWGGVAAAWQTARWNRAALRRVAMGIGIVLFVSFFLLEYVPSEPIPDSQLVNGIPFRDIVGSYYRGDGVGVNGMIDIGRDGRFSILASGCTGVYRRNRGGIVAYAETITLCPKRPEYLAGFSRDPITLVPVRWGDRVYLLPPGKMENFCFSIKAGMEPRNRKHGLFYLRAGTWSNPATGFPELVWCPRNSF